MLNKKILAVAVASAFSLNAFATQDITDATTEAVIFADELITDAATVDVTNAGNILDVQTTYGFSIADGTSKYVRFELSNATFNTAVTDAQISSSNGFAGFAISQGGADGDSVVIVEVSAVGGDIQQSDTITLAAVDLTISQTATTTITATLHDDAPDAVANESALATQTGEVAEVAVASTGDFTDEAELTSTVASGFKSFDTTPANALSATLGYVGTIDVTNIPATAGAYTAAGALVTAADLITDAQDVTFTGDFSFGQWNLQDDATCGGGGSVDVDLTAVLNTDENEATASIASLAAGPYYLCVDISGLAADEVVLKSSYDAELVTDTLSNEVGEIVYDTTSIEVPVLTTFSSYNQRIYLVNTGSSAASYSFSFISEDGVTATAGTAATGSIPAGEMIAIKATDIVTLTGRTRTSAVIEVEAQEDDISAASQTVNLSTSGTDTVVLF